MSATGSTLRVVDHGPGIPAAERERVFQPVPAARTIADGRRRGPRAGRGQGLRRGHGRRADGRGHAGRRRHDASCRPAAEPRDAQAVTRVLVVDDEPPFARALAINLRARGYDVDIAGTGGEALRPGGPNPSRRRDARPRPARHRRRRRPAAVCGAGRGADHRAVGARRRDRQGRRPSTPAPTTTSPSRSAMDELLARLRAALRRGRPRRRGAAIVTHRRLHDRPGRQAASTPDGGDVHLTPTEWRVVEVLVRNQGKLVTPAAAAPAGVGPAVRARRPTTCGSTWRRSAASSSPTPPDPATSSPSRAWATASSLSRQMGQPDVRRVMLPFSQLFHFGRYALRRFLVGTSKSPAPAEGAAKRVTEGPISRW